MSLQSDQASRKRKLSPTKGDAPSAVSVGSNVDPSTSSGASAAKTKRSAPKCNVPAHEQLIRQLEKMYRESSAELKEAKDEEEIVSQYDRFQQVEYDEKRGAFEYHHDKIKELYRKVKDSNPELDLIDVSVTDDEEEVTDDEDDEEHGS